ncbi:unnamed protein product (mitochondrion) [Plasmodiophora brassicae]|uniref:Uncharacterized protein n=1 Tax=Plasmodiophora brassicae TaxID=37360 RepID=A0A3P3YLD2_PLABS|nr:unnamed protein product [Plasmodiophora brassicae]
MSTLSTWKPSSRPAHMALRPGSHRVAFDAGLYKEPFRVTVAMAKELEPFQHCADAAGVQATDVCCYSASVLPR